LTVDAREVAMHGILVIVVAMVCSIAAGPLGGGAPDTCRIATRTNGVSETFTFYIDSAGDTVRHGKYRREGPEQEDVVEGAYVDGLRDGAWHVAEGSILVNQTEHWVMGVLHGPTQLTRRKDREEPRRYVQGRREGEWILADTHGYTLTFVAAEGRYSRGP